MKKLLLRLAGYKYVGCVFRGKYHPSGKEVYQFVAAPILNLYLPSATHELTGPRIDWEYFKPIEIKYFRDFNEFQTLGEFNNEVFNNKYNITKDKWEFHIRTFSK